ncbi:MAG: DUF2628 domain-containing protein [Firmicutes bacterium]|nr:DUF2628 domain-containing protein [Bacillota bacterium]
MIIYIKLILNERSLSLKCEICGEKTKINHGTGQVICCEICSLDEQNLKSNFLDTPNKKEVQIEENGQLTEKGALKIFIGDEADYYLRQFNNIKNDITPRWHWPASFCTLCWAGYRKMYSYILITVIIFFVFDLSLIALGAPKYIEDVRVVNNILGIILLIIFGINANRLYYMHAKKKVNEIMCQYNDIEKQKEELAKAGGTSNLGVGFALLATLTQGLVILALLNNLGLV